MRVLLCHFLLAAALLCSISNLNAQITYMGNLNTNHKNVSQLAITPNNRYAYAIAYDEIQIYQRNEVNGQLTFLSAINQMSDGTMFNALTTLAISPDGNFLYVSGSFRIFVLSCNTLTGSLTSFQTIHHSLGSGYNNNFAFNANGNHIYVALENDIVIYKKDSLMAMLSLVDTLEDVNDYPGWLYDVSVILSPDNKLAYVTGGQSVSVFNRDTTTGRLTFKSVIAGDNSYNQGLINASQSVIHPNGRVIYTVTNSMGDGALVVLLRDTITNKLLISQTIINTIRPQSINISSDGLLVFISSGPGSSSDAVMFYLADSVTGKLQYLSTYKNSVRYTSKKCLDGKDRYMYTCPLGVDSIYMHRFNLFLDSVTHVCAGNVVKLKPWGDYMSYMWSDSSINHDIIATMPGWYALTATDSEGNIYTDSVKIVFQKPINLGNDTTLYPGDILILNNGGYTDFNWNWDGYEYSDTYFYIQNNGDSSTTKPLVLNVTDDYGCFITDTLLVTFSFINAHTIDNSDLKVYPNPFISNISILYIDSFALTLNVFVRNLEGQIVYNYEETDMPIHIPYYKVLDLGYLPNGVYFITVVTTAGTVVQQAVKL